MKKLLIFLLFISAKKICIAQQDSMRTVNDKPGTPSSLRTPYNAPTNTVHVINPAVPQNQTIKNVGMESSGVNNVQQKKIVPFTSYTPAPPPFSTNKPVLKPNTIVNPDSVANIKPPNVSDPTHR